jgi:hypothetical protein
MKTKRKSMKSRITIRIKPTNHTIKPTEEKLCPNIKNKKCDKKRINENKTCYHSLTEIRK